MNKTCHIVYYRDNIFGENCTRIVIGICRNDRYWILRLRPDFLLNNFKIKRINQPTKTRTIFHPLTDLTYFKTFPLDINEFT